MTVERAPFSSTGAISPTVAHFGKAFIVDVSKALDNVEEWPKNDLFEEFEKSSTKSRRGKR